MVNFLPDSMSKDDFNSFPQLDSNIATTPECGVYISQLIRHDRPSSLYSVFINLITKLLSQGCSKDCLITNNDK
jgi:hypothetical protein